MGSQTLSHSAHGGISHHGDLLDVSVVISYEAEVGRHCAKTLPSGKSRGLDHDAREASRLLDIRVDRFRELSEVALLETTRNLHMQDGVRRVECVIDHLWLSCIAPAQSEQTHFGFGALICLCISRLHGSLCTARRGPLHFFGITVPSASATIARR